MSEKKELLLDSNIREPNSALWWSAVDQPETWRIFSVCKVKGLMAEKPEQATLTNDGCLIFETIVHA